MLKSRCSLPSKQTDVQIEPLQVSPIPDFLTNHGGQDGHGQPSSSFGDFGRDLSLHPQVVACDLHPKKSI